MVPNVWKMLLERGLRFVQLRRTRNSVEERDPICVCPKGIAKQLSTPDCAYPKVFWASLSEVARSILAPNFHPESISCLSSVTREDSFLCNATKW